MSLTYREDFDDGPGSWNDPQPWMCIGARHDMGRSYCDGDIAQVLEDVKVDLIRVLFPLRVVPLDGVDPDRLWGNKDDPVGMQYLPKGPIMFGRVQIDDPRDPPTDGI